MDPDPAVAVPPAADPVAAACVQHYGWLRAWLGGRIRHAGREVVESLFQDTMVRMLASPARMQRIAPGPAGEFLSAPGRSAAMRAGFDGHAMRRRL